MKELIHYDTACRELAKARNIDEVKDIRDKAIALEHYAKQAMNLEAETFAMEIRLRAERKVGKLLKEKERAPAGAARSPKGRAGNKPTDQREPQVSEYAKAKTDAGISDTQAKRWQALAKVPEKEFEEALKDPNEKPSTTGIIKKTNGSSTRINPDALWLWGAIRDLSRKKFSAGFDVLLGEMTPVMVDTLKASIPAARGVLSELSEALNESDKTID